MSRPHVVVVGLGDTGVLSAVRLSRHARVTAVTTRTELVSGQELGMRLARPEEWARDYRVPLRRYRRLDEAEVVHGAATDLDAAVRTLTVRLADGETRDLTYDALVVATGVANGFWRDDRVVRPDDTTTALAAHHRAVAGATRVAVVGGGAAAVATAAAVAERWPATRVDLYFPRDRALVQHHPRVWRRVARRLTGLGVGLHPGHRARVEDDGPPAGITSGTVAWTTGQAPVEADAVVWALGRVVPHTGWLPADVLDEHGFVRVTPRLEVVGAPGVFAVGDVAATDPLRTSARNGGHHVLAHNVRAHLSGGRLRSYRPPRRRWGSVLGRLSDGLVVFAPDGRGYRIPAVVDRRVVRPFVVDARMYLGVRRAR